jgi:hypothetical protein
VRRELDVRGRYNVIRASRREIAALEKLL